MKIDKLLPRDIEKLSYVQKELYIRFPDESKEILLAIKDIRSSNLEEDEMDLLLEGLEENLKSNSILVEEIDKILNFKGKVEEVKEKVQESANRVIVADEPYAVSEKELKELTQSTTEVPVPELTSEQTEVPVPNITQEQAQVPVPDLTPEQAQVPVPDLTPEQAEVPNVENNSEINMKVEDINYTPQEETPKVVLDEEPKIEDTPEEETIPEEPKQEVPEETKQEVHEEPKQEVHEDVQKEVEFKNAVYNHMVDTNKFLKAMVDFIVKDLTVETYRSFEANSDEEVVKALLKEEGYDV